MKIMEGIGAEVAKTLAYEEYEAFDEVCRHEETIGVDLADLEEVGKKIESG